MISKPICGAYPDPMFCMQYGIVGRWLFNEKGSKIIDVCRNFNTGAISGAYWTSSKMAGGLRFDGTDDYVNIGTNYQKYIDYNKTFSVSIWFTFSAVAASYYSLIGVVRATGGYDAFEIRKSSSHRIEFLLWTYAGAGNTNGYNWGSEVQSFVIGKLYNVTVTYDGTGTSTAAKIYLNGVSIYPGTIVNNFGDLTNSFSAQLSGIDLWVGRRNHTSPDQPFPGIIDQVIIANRGWTQDEVNKLYRNPWCGLISSNQFTQEYSQMAALGAD